MTVGVPKDRTAGETRVCLIPQTVEKLVQIGINVRIESGLGEVCRISDGQYTDAGAETASNGPGAVEDADVVVRLNKPTPEEVAQLPEGCVHISYLEPFTQQELVQALADKGVTAVCMELIPRSTRAQKMDALSSQASLAGYVAVVIAAERLDSVFPMMTTPAGTIYPSRVFVIGAGVAGLQAIATAKRLGARVEAFDTRPVVEEQVRSLGAKFVKVDLGDQGQTKDGYAKALTEEQLSKQREMMKQHCADSDVVITTAQVFGRKAPLIVTAEMVRGMRPGSVVVDMAAETGGNVELTQAGKEVMENGVRVVGLTNLAGYVPVHSSQMYSSNIAAFLSEFWDQDKKSFSIDQEDEILTSCIVTRDGEIVSERLKEAYR